MKTKLDKEIEQHLQKAYDLGLAEVKRLVFKVFAKKKTYVRFFLAMGATFFEDKNGDNFCVYDEDVAVSALELRNFLMEWDEDLKLSGEGVYWTREGEEIRNW